MTNPLFDALLGNKRDSEATALILPDARTISYAALAGEVARLAWLLRHMGFAKGDRLALQAPKSATALATYLACLHEGVVFVPLNTAYTPDEVAYFLSDATPKLLVADRAAEPALAPHAEAVAARILTLDADGAGSLADAAKAVTPADAPRPCRSDDLACFLYTSGTTGRSKGAMLSQGNLLSNAETLRSSWRFAADDVLLHALPIFHAHGLFVACNVLMSAGGAMIWQPGFKAEAVIDALPQATAMMGVPTFYTRLLDAPDFTAEVAGHIRLFTSGSAPLLAETHDRFRDRTGHAILERYGMTETGMNTSNPYDGARRAGTVGLPLPGVELRITRPGSDKEVAAGDTGMIEVRGPNVFGGYWQMPEKTAEELRPDGFFITGDLGRIDPDGYVTIVGRDKDLIISGGYNVYPKEVEQLLDGLEGIRESAVIGAPHADFGEAVVAILVPETGAEVEIAGIEAEVTRRLANYKRPKRYILRDVLPRNTMGKVQKNVLRQTFADLFQPDDTALKQAGE